MPASHMGDAQWSSDHLSLVEPWLSEPVDGRALCLSLSYHSAFQITIAVTTAVCLLMFVYLKKSAKASVILILVYLVGFVFCYFMIFRPLGKLLCTHRVLCTLSNFRDDSVVFSLLLEVLES